MIYPEWVLEQGTDDSLETRQRKIAYLLRCAALTHNQSAHLCPLAESLGLDPSSFHQAIRRGRLSPRIKVLIAPLLTPAQQKELDEISP